MSGVGLHPGPGAQEFLVPVGSNQRTGKDILHQEPKHSGGRLLKRVGWVLEVCQGD